MPATAMIRQIGSDIEKAIATQSKIDVDVSNGDTIQISAAFVDGSVQLSASVASPRNTRRA